MPLEIGQTLYLYQTDARYRDRAPRIVTVKKIGRKWATIDHGEKVDIETLTLDAGQFTPSERCYLSIEQRENERRLNATWDNFRRSADRSWSTPTSNVESIREAAALLGFPDPMPRAAVSTPSGGE